ncbi:SDR family oxidoreductase [Frigidibacter oleivorans]|uniref:SDR family oxidoreductase n=1 Tax=Frigidibacter oleivorans TaxID=2487129 RepID=UPI000F8CCDAF|nr:SDR family oxidoreductase [Frigidibacter oleivorans]
MTQDLAKSPVLILGGRSDIGLACARAFAAAGHPLQLAARNAATLEPAAQDLRLRGGGAVSLHEFDVLDIAGHAAFLDALPEPPGIVLCAVGAMGDQEASERDPQAAALVMRANFEGPALILGEIANRMEAAGRGVIVGISSVAGDRGRATNYVYGAGKAGFTAFLSGLRNRLARTGVQVVTVKPGFVATRMTEGMDTPAPLTAQPEEVARAILRAIRTGGTVVYVRPVWRLVMTAIRAIPEPLFKRMKL